MGGQLLCLVRNNNVGVRNKVCIQKRYTKQPSKLCHGVHLGLLRNRLDCATFLAGIFGLK